MVYSDRICLKKKTTTTNKTKQLLIAFNFIFTFFFLFNPTVGAPEVGGPERRLGRPGGPRALEGRSRWLVAQNEASSQHALQPDTSPSACSSGDNNPVILQASSKEPGSGTMQSSPSPAHPQLPILQTQV